MIRGSSYKKSKGRERPYCRIRPKRSSGRKIAVLLLIFLLGLLIFSLAAEAAWTDSVGSGWNRTKGNMSKAWNKIKIFAMSGKFWINFVLIFAALFLGFNIFLKEKLGSDTATKVMLYIIIGVLAMILASKIVDSAGNPSYLWEEGKFRDATKFLIGPTDENALRTCPESSLVDGFLSSFGIGGEPPCCGTGAYMKEIKGEKKCKQAILRINETGAGLPAFLFASVIFFILFNWLLSNLDRKYNIGLSVFLAALLANERITKDQILITAGWVAFILASRMLLAKWARREGEEEEAFWGKALAIAVPYAAVNLALGIFGTSLFHGTISSAEVGLPMITVNFLIGLGIGAGYATMTSDPMKKKWDKMAKTRKAHYKSLFDEGKHVRAVLSWLPVVGGFYRTFFTDFNIDDLEEGEEEDESNLTELERLNREENRVGESLRREWNKPDNQRDYRRIDYLERQLVRITRLKIALLNPQQQNAAITRLPHRNPNPNAGQGGRYRGGV